MGGLFNPFISPNGLWIGYVAGPATAGASGQLRKIPVQGGAPQTLSPMSAPFGASWSEEGAILIGQREGIVQVPESGGEPANSRTSTARPERV